MNGFARGRRRPWQVKAQTADTQAQGLGETHSEEAPADDHLFHRPPRRDRRACRPPAAGRLLRRSACAQVCSLSVWKRGVDVRAGLGGVQCARAPPATSSPARFVSEMPRPISGDRIRKQFRADETMAVGKATNLRMAAAVAGGKRALMREESPSPTTSDAPTALQYDLRTSHPPHQLRGAANTLEGAGRGGARTGRVWRSGSGSSRCGCSS